jgi:altered-inheritance-of-mitochondria protein 5
MVSNSGIITTSSVAYLTALELRRNSQTISKSLQVSKEVLDNRGKPKPRMSKTIEYETRDNVAETMKDLWDHEIVRAANWIFSLGSR